MDFADLLNQLDGVQAKENIRLKRAYNRLVRESKDCPWCDEPPKKKMFENDPTQAHNLHGQDNQLRETEEEAVPKKPCPSEYGSVDEKVVQDFFFECGEKPVEKPAPASEEPAPEEPKEEPKKEPANGLTKEEFFNIEEQEAVTGEQKKMKPEDDTFGDEGTKEEGGKTQDPPPPEGEENLPPPPAEPPVENPAPETPVDENDPTQAHNLHGQDNQLREGNVPVEQPDLNSFFGQGDEPKEEPAPENPAPAEPAPEEPKEEPKEEPAPEEPAPEEPKEEPKEEPAPVEPAPEEPAPETPVDENDPTQAHNLHGQDNQLREDSLSDEEIRAYIEGLKEDETEPLPEEPDEEPAPVEPAPEEPAPKEPAPEDDLDDLDDLEEDVNSDEQFSQTLKNFIEARPEFFGK